ncbi:MAG: asparaginase [Bacteroidota bacterium]
MAVFRSSVLLIYTGGTIGMAEDPSTGQLTPFRFDHLTSQVPELKKFGVSIHAVSFEHPLDSSDMKPEIWVKMAEMIAENYDVYDGFVILHGSDTMAYTASALSFMLQHLGKPVILTGSQLPIGTIRTDGKENLITAIEIAAAKNETGQPMVPEVAIYFEYRLLRGNRTTKVSANHFNAFASGNYPELAEAGVTISWNHQDIRPLPAEKFILNKKLCADIAILKIFPGIPPFVVKAICSNPSLKGLILETFGSGNATTDTWFIDELQALVGRGVPVINVTQCYSGSVQQGKYKTSSAFNEIGVISGHDMTTEAAVTKLMCLLGNNTDLYEIRQAFASSFCGEVTVPSATGNV